MLRAAAVPASPARQADDPYRSGCALRVVGAARGEGRPVAGEG